MSKLETIITGIVDTALRNVVLEFDQTIHLKDVNGNHVADIKLVDDGKYGRFLIVEPNEATVPTKFRVAKPVS